MTTGLVYTRALPCQAGVASWNRRNASHHLYGFRCTEGDVKEAGFVPPYRLFFGDCWPAGIWHSYCDCLEAIVRSHAPLDRNITWRCNCEALLFDRSAIEIAHHDERSKRTVQRFPRCGRTCTRDNSHTTVKSWRARSRETTTD